MGDLVIERDELQEENQMLKNDLIDSNKYDSEKYKKLDRTLITKSHKKTIAKQYLCVTLTSFDLYKFSIHSK
jgi:hypothetical protein